MCRCHYNCKVAVSLKKGDYLDASTCCASTYAAPNRKGSCSATNSVLLNVRKYKREFVLQFNNLLYPAVDLQQCPYCLEDR